MAASTQRLGGLHAIVCDVIENRLAKEDELMVDGLIPNAATLNAAVAFLKNNNITADEGTMAGYSFADRIKQRREQAAVRAAKLKASDRELDA